MAGLVLAVFALALIPGVLLGLKIRRKNCHIWLPAYLRRDWPGRRESTDPAEPIHILFCVADHWEPGLGDAERATERQRVSKWLDEYPRMADRFRDADGLSPTHTFFYPAEEFDAEHIDRLAELVKSGYGELEVHLHHDGDTPERMQARLTDFLAQLSDRGLTGRGDGPRFSFVHGNWALDNSLPDGRWCGVNNELQVLRECGCYADFTYPSAPSPSQTRRINSIYYATDDPERPRSADDGTPVRVGAPPTGDLMLVQGPLLPVLYKGFLPSIENGNIAAGQEPSPSRLRAWIRARVCVGGRPNWVFVKVHTHGCKEANWPALFGDGMLRVHEELCGRYCSGRYRTHYVSARELYNIVKAAEAGMEGDPGRYRDFAIAAPAVAHPRTAG